MQNLLTIDRARQIAAALRYPGWRAVAVAICIFFFAFGAPMTMPLVYPEVMKEFGWSLTQATLIYTYKSLTGAVMAIFIIGPLVDRIGLKPVMVGAMLAEAIGLSSFLFVSSLWSYYLSGFLIGIGQAAVIITVRLYISRWFVRNVGLANGIAIIGTSFGGIAFPLIASQLIPLYGWRMAFAGLSLGVFCVSIPLALFARTNPSEADVLPDAAKVANNADPDSLRAAELDISYRELFTQRTFWLIAIATFLSAGVDQAVFQHSIFYLTKEAGLTRTVAASALSVTFLIGIFAKFGAGAVYDRFSVKGVSGWNILLVVALLMLLPVQGYATALTFAIVMGVAHAGLVVDGPVVSKHVYGPRYMNRVLPIFAGFNTMGSATGPVLLAMFYDHQGSYVMGISIFAVLVVIAAAMLWQVRPFYRERLRALGGDQGAS
ncbi:nitrate/nitrite transporter [Sphingomonas canadensis]|uniref:Nitrate/nitrite transporter n=1 Tax=Sphingomonas canadensis TaxID=1219257 RepID=A0ABW3H8Y3_9SPHN|nr:MFS transporter [Sphingomonas canadensis]MCW3837625.1 MFS transporter [Sphingomonas canadensis]